MCVLHWPLAVHWMTPTIEMGSRVVSLAFATRRQTQHHPLPTTHLTTHHPRNKLSENFLPYTNKKCSDSPARTVRKVRAFKRLSPPWAPTWPPNCPESPRRGPQFAPYGSERGQVSDSPRRTVRKFFVGLRQKVFGQFVAWVVGGEVGGGAIGGPSWGDNRLAARERANFSDSPCRIVRGGVPVSPGRGSRRTDWVCGTPLRTMRAGLSEGGSLSGPVSPGAWSCLISW